MLKAIGNRSFNYPNIFTENPVKFDILQETVRFNRCISTTHYSIILDDITISNDSLPTH